jgi:hypothetical protein
MKIPILVEPIENDGYRATSGPPLAASAEGATREEALVRLREEIHRRMSDGAIVMPLDITTTEEKPSIWGFGMFKDNPLFDEWQAAIEEYRRKVDEGDPLLSLEEEDPVLP